MMLRYGLGEAAAADAIDATVIIMTPYYLPIDPLLTPYRPPKDTGPGTVLVPSNLGTPAGWGDFSVSH
eukprot:1119251-Prorocentrum_minimum.AAC.1